MKTSLFELINAIAILILSGLIAWARYREKRLTERYKLGPNPERCARHEERLNQLENETKELRAENRQEHGKIFNALDDIRQRLTRVEAKMNGVGK